MFLCQKPDFIIWIIVDIWEHFLKLTHYKFCKGSFIIILFIVFIILNRLNTEVNYVFVSNQNFIM